MFCEEIVAYYVECTNVVKKWYESDCDNQGCQGRQGRIFKLLSEFFSSALQRVADPLTKNW